jgi:hypothetical protein
MPRVRNEHRDRPTLVTLALSRRQTRAAAKSQCREINTVAGLRGVEGRGLGDKGQTRRPVNLGVPSRSGVWRGGGRGPGARRPRPWQPPAPLPSCPAKSDENAGRRLAGRRTRQVERSVPTASGRSIAVDRDGRPRRPRSEKGKLPAEARRGIRPRSCAPLTRIRGFADSRPHLSYASSILYSHFLPLIVTLAQLLAAPDE